MKNKYAPKLTVDEAKRLERFVDTNGGQAKASVLLNVAAETLSRTANRHTAPSQLFRDKLVEQGIVKE